MTALASGALAVLLAAAAIPLAALDHPRLAAAAVAASVLLLILSFAVEHRSSRP